MTTLEININKRLIGRGAVEFVQAFTPVKGEVYLELKDRHVSVKSLLGVLSSNINQGDIVTLTIMNDEDVEVVKKIISEKLK